MLQGHSEAPGVLFPSPKVGHFVNRMTVNPSSLKNSTWLARGLQRLNNVWHWLIKTPDWLSESKRRQAQLLAGLLVAVLTPLLGTVILALLILLLAPSRLTPDAIPLLALSILLLLLAYRL